MYRIVLVGLLCTIGLTCVGGCGCKDNEPLKITDRSRLDRLPGPPKPKHP
jgi:hypothetical protein